MPRLFLVWRISYAVQNRIFSYTFERATKIPGCPKGQMYFGQMSSNVEMLQYFCPLIVSLLANNRCVLIPNKKIQAAIKDINKKCQIMEFNVLVQVSKQVEKMVPGFKTTKFNGLDWFSSWLLIFAFGKLEPIGRWYPLGEANCLVRTHMPTRALQRNVK